ncbi:MULTISPECIES: DUF6384 family protein [Rhodomicrobium]|uniref:DUF6384 family protein n=1 Tax=Rhodomicrobium TaxID=1068 RepID=UPI000B4BE382|nr:MULTISPECIES: DUF6384 family protein [Rhodomicrobium]
MNAAAEGAKPPLDEVMLSMDVVDTIRQDQRVAEQEMDEDTRRKGLIARLREIYHGQGIEVPDHILEEGVRALDERRFVYEPPRSSFSVALARLYVSRWRWAKSAGVVALVLGGISLGWQAFHVWPQAQREAAARTELSTTLPSRLNTLLATVDAETSNPAVEAKAKQLHDSGLAAAAAGQAEPARAASADLAALLDELRLAYNIKIVSRPGEMSGIWRVPKVNPQGKNYYLVVEAVDANGRVLERPVVNEETGRAEKVKKWAVRVPESTFSAIQADKRDDGIIQRAVIGVKRRGELDPEWRIETLGGALTQW